MGNDSLSQSEREIDYVGIEIDRPWHHKGQYLSVVANDGVKQGRTEFNLSRHRIAALGKAFISFPGTPRN